MRGFWSLLLIFVVIMGTVLPLLGALIEAPVQNVGSSLDLSILAKSDVEQKDSGMAFVPGELLVKFRSRASVGEAAALKLGLGAEEAGFGVLSQVRRWRMPISRTVEEWVDLLRRNPLIEFAEPNYYYRSSMVPNDPAYEYQWHLDNPVYGGIGMEEGWNLASGIAGVVVAVVDTGVAYENYVAPDYWHISTYKAYSGSSWWCGVSSAPVGWVGSGSTPPGYGDGWREYLQHGFDLTSATGTVTFSYQYRHHLENGYDYAYVEISSNGGYSWTQLKSYTGPPIPGQVRWRSDSVDLSAFKGNNVLVRFRVASDDLYSDEDGFFNSDGAFFVDEIRLTDGSGTLFYDSVESGPGSWETTRYELASDLAGTSFWHNSGEVLDDDLDNDGNGFVDDAGGWDFINADAHPNDDNAHGTHVAGTIAQTTNNGFGVAGVAFGTTIMPVKVLNAAGSGTLDGVAEGIHYAVDNGANVISMSLGGPSSPSLESAVAYAYNNGVTVIAASGNEATGTVSYPAAYDNYVIAVGATQYDETKAPYSNYGSSLDIVAPGGNTGVDQNGDGYPDGVLQNTFGVTPVDWAYWFFQGTSMATPHVSGVAALLLARDRTLTPDEVRNALQSTANDLGTSGRDNTFGWGLVNAEAALRSIARSVHLLLNVEPSRIAYSRGESVTFGISVLNELNPPLDTTLTLTITGPNSCYYFESQPIKAVSDAASEFTFTWKIPAAVGTYVVEASLVPAQLTAYDSVWLNVE